MRTSADWPELTLAIWAGTPDAPHLWTEMVGMSRLALEPMVNHRWQVPLSVSARGLSVPPTTIRSQPHLARRSA